MHMDRVAGPRNVKRPGAPGDSRENGRLARRLPNWWLRAISSARVESGRIKSTYKASRVFVDSRRVRRLPGAYLSAAQLLPCAEASEATSIALSLTRRSGTCERNKTEKERCIFGQTTCRAAASLHANQVEENFNPIWRRHLYCARSAPSEERGPQRRTRYDTHRMVAARFSPYVTKRCEQPLHLSVGRGCPIAFSFGSN